MVFTKSKEGFENLKKTRPIINKVISQSQDSIYNSSTDTKTILKTGQCVYFIIKGVDSMNVKKVDKDFLSDIIIPILIDDKEMKLTIKDSNHNLIFKT